MERVGVRLRSLRHELGLSQSKLAKACGLTASFLSQAERGLSSISISTLERICAALGVSLAEFFSKVEADPALPDEGSQVLHVADQRVVVLSEASIRYRFLSRESHGSHFDVVVGEIPRGYTFPLDAHEGEEFGYIISGTLRLLLNGESHEIVAGDSFHIRPYVSHGYEALGNKDVCVLWVQTLRNLDIRSGVPKR